jgi:hypothetical protein
MNELRLTHTVVAMAIRRDFPQEGRKMGLGRATYVGFYWTLPVPWAGFLSLPKDVDEAAAASRTVRYQRERVRRWVGDQNGALVGEEVFLEVAPDRGTAEVKDALEPALAGCRAHAATLVVVDFASTYGWRSHSPLQGYLETSDVTLEWLDPAEELVDGAWFDPVHHFRTWRHVQEAHQEAKPAHRARVKAVIGASGAQRASYAELARILNSREVFTHGGKPWTADNLRKFLKNR